MFKSLRITNFRSIEDSTKLPLGPITLIIGKNNTGKSALLRAIYSIQEGSYPNQSDIRIGEGNLVATVEIEFDQGIPFARHVNPNGPPEISGEGLLRYSMSRDDQGTLETFTDQNSWQLANFSGQEPNNLIYPIFAGRRLSRYQEQISEQHATAVGPTDNSLVSKVLTLSTGSFPEAVKFRRLCRKILGIDLSVFAAENSQSLGIQVSRYKGIPLEAMGSGVSAALGMIVSLSDSRRKIFLIEEPENDLHPEALKGLLEAIIEASEMNQFIITTHSSVVLAKLGAVRGSVVLHAASSDTLPATSIYKTVDTPRGRLGVLQDLGYELADLGLGEGWLIFEESSAERIVREWFIPWYAPRLARLRTLGASGVTRIEPVMLDFKEMFLFAHIEGTYRGRAWVVVDGDDVGKSVIARLREEFRSWPPSHFQHWDKPAFEYYYPSIFSNRVSSVMAITGKRERRAAKADLLYSVLQWIERDPELARSEFEISASEVIDRLKEIEIEVTQLGLVASHKM
jgi:hypothetical protein